MTPPIQIITPNGENNWDESLFDIVSWECEHGNFDLMANPSESNMDLQYIPTYFVVNPKSLSFPYTMVYCTHTNTMGTIMRSSEDTVRVYSKLEDALDYTNRIVRVIAKEVMP